MDKETKQKVLALIKSIDVKEEYSSEREDRRKWFRFGAYDALRTISQMINDYEEPPEQKPKKKAAESAK